MFGKSQCRKNSKFRINRTNLAESRQNRSLVRVTSLSPSCVRLQSAVEPVSRELKGGWTLHRWLKDDLPSGSFEPNAPGWHLQGTAIEFSDFSDWSAVAMWIDTLWGKAEVPDDLKDIARGIVKSAGADEVARADAALAFVRDEVRYLGLEDGIGSLQPCPMTDVLRRRFGDCKDKSRLLCLLLRLLKIPASPMLVNTVVGRGVEEMLPSPGAFDHVIVCTKVGGKAVWVDPTRRSLAKSIVDLPPPNYGHALPVSSKAKGLRAIPATPSDAALLVVKETYTIKDLKSPVALTVEQTASGFEAEHLREIIGALGKARYRDLREAEMRETYPGAKAVGDWESDLDPATLSPTSREHFEISDFVLDSGEGDHAIAFGPTSLRGRLPGTPTDGDRQSPWALPYPCRIRHESLIHLPSPVPESDDSFGVDSETFGYKTSVKAGGDRAMAVFRYWSKSDHVSPDELATYRSDYDQISKHSAPVIPLPRSGGSWKKAQKASAQSESRSDSDVRRRHHHGRSKNPDDRRKKLVNIVGTIVVLGTVIGIFSATKDKGKLPKVPPPPKRTIDPTMTAEYRSVFGSPEEAAKAAQAKAEAEAAAAAGKATPSPDSAAATEQETKPEEEGFSGSLLDGPSFAPSFGDQPKDPKYQNLKNLDLKL